ncbi:MAG: glycosyltransferase [Bryobacterales bacterium]|nr:glycosyltransferase [Bryobacterales bacterium]
MDGVEVERVFLRSTHGRGWTQIPFYAAVYAKLLWRAARVDFDAIHCHDLDTLPAGFVAGLLRRRPVVYDSHESFPDMLTGSVPAAIRRGLTLLENWLIRRVAVVITVGDKLRRFFEQRGARRAVVVGNWKRSEEFAIAPADRAALRRELGIPDGALAVVCITQLLGDRKLLELFDAVDAVDNVYCIVAGSGSLEPMVRARAARNPRIIYAGRLKPAEIPRYTCAADAIYYGFDPANPNARFSAPNKLYEALAAGLPLITGDFGEIGEVVRTHGCGIVLETYSAESVARAMSTLQDEATRREMGARAHRLGREEFHWNAAERTLHAEYGRLLRRGKLALAAGV